MSSDPASLDLLHDLVAPPPAPWWPPAPGWYYVLALLGGVGLVGLVRGFIRWQRNRYRREALAEWARLATGLHDPTRRAAVLAELAALLKRTALTAYTRAEVAALSGPDWFAFLDRTGRMTVFGGGAGGQLAAAAYDPASIASLDEPAARAVAAGVRDWIKQHTPSADADGRPGGSDSP